MKKKNVNQQKVVNSMKVNYEMTIEENKELELQVDGQQPNIKKSRIFCIFWHFL